MSKLLKKFWGSNGIQNHNLYVIGHQGDALPTELWSLAGSRSGAICTRYWWFQILLEPQNFFPWALFIIHVHISYFITARITFTCILYMRNVQWIIQMSSTWWLGGFHLPLWKYCMLCKVFIYFSLLRNYSNLNGNYLYRDLKCDIIILQTFPLALMSEDREVWSCTQSHTNLSYLGSVTSNK